MSRTEHQNHFNLIRMVAATLVLVSHSYALSTGDPSTEPLRRELGVTWGSIAVDVFFVTSGFLVTASIMQRGSVRDFVIARALRIYPGLVVALLVTVAVCGTWFTSLSPATFWSDSATWRYLLKNAVLLHPFGIEYALPGTLQGVPYTSKGLGPVNGSLWTLPVELRMYLCLVLGYAAVRALTRRAGGTTSIHRWARPTLTMAAGVLLCVDLYYSVNAGHRLVPHMAAMFFVGGALWCFRIDFTRTWRLAIVLLVLVLVGATIGQRTFLVCYTLSLPVIVLSLAYMPVRRLLVYNQAGDYSYGMYIYAFPVQQWTLALWTGIGTWTLTAVSIPSTLALAALSWHLIEKRALAMKPQRRG